MKGVFGILAGALLVSSCADLMKVRTIEPKKSKKSNFAEESNSGGFAGEGNPVARVKKPNEDVAVGVAPEEAGYLPAQVGEGVTAGGLLLYSDDTIAWSPDDPNADIPFNESFDVKPKSKSSWLVSYSSARRESMRTGKPVLMWFTRTASPASPICARLQREVFGKLDFGNWANEELVRLKVDISGGSEQSGRIQGDLVKKRKFAEKLKKQYRVLGYPTVILLQPDGSVYLRERGFKKGGKKEFWNKLKDAVLTIDHNRGVWERNLAKKGYRNWVGKKTERVIFAKLGRFHEKSGTVILVEPNGNQIKTSVKTLSNDDRGWLKAEKKRLGH